MAQLSQPTSLRILLAEDDDDDRFVFKTALEETGLAYKLTVVNNGEQLMRSLNESTVEDLPHVLFLDINMPRKNGFECLAEIKGIEKLRPLKIIIFSSHPTQHMEQHYQNGVIYYMRKPNSISQYKKVIHEALEVLKKHLA